MSRQPRLSVAWLMLVASLFTVHHVLAAPLGTGKLTEAHDAVFWTPVNASEASIQSGEALGKGGTLRTGAGSRAEVHFSDQSLVRLGANASLAMDPQGQQLILQRGSLLFHGTDGTPIRIVSPAGTVTVQGGTVAVAVNAQGLAQIVCLSTGAEGSVRVGLQGSDRIVELRSGQTVLANPSSPGLFKPAHMSVEVFAQTSGLLRRENGFQNPLPESVQQGLKVAMQAQHKQLRSGSLAMARQPGANPGSDAAQLTSVNQTAIQAANWHHQAGTYLLTAADGTKALMTMNSAGNGIVQPASGGSASYFGLVVVNSAPVYFSSSGVLVGSLGANGGISTLSGGSLTIGH